MPSAHQARGRDAKRVNVSHAFYYSLVESFHCIELLFIKIR